MFAIVAQQRSGTHFLGSLLDSHPALRSLGEEILSSKGVKNNFYAYLGAKAARNPDVVRPQNQHAIWRSFVDSLAQKRPGIRHIGIILMYNQIELISPHLIERILAGIRIIHLIRGNTLRTHVSDYINRNTEKPAHSDLPSELIRVTLPSDTLVEELRTRTRRIAKMRELLSRWKHIEVTYEELLHSREEALLRLQGFLDVPGMQLDTSLQASNPWPLKEILLNYCEVQTALRDSEFAGMIE